MVINMIKHCWNSDTHFCVLLTTCQHLIDLIFQRALRQINHHSAFTFVSAFWFYRLAETKINFVYDNNPNQAFKLFGLTTIYYGYKLNFRHLIKQILTRHYTILNTDSFNLNKDVAVVFKITTTYNRHPQEHVLMHNCTWLTPMHVCLVLTRHLTAAAAAWIRFGKFTVIRTYIHGQTHTLHRLVTEL